MSSKCCGSCAFLKCNFGKPNPAPENINDKSKIGDIQWYTQENIDRLWMDNRDMGHFLTCHSTDPSYYAKDKNKLTACLGFVFCTYMHVKIFEVKGGPTGNFRNYTNAVGKKVAMTKRGMFEAAFSMATGYADLFQQMKIPLDISEDRKLLFPTGFEKTIEVFKTIMPSFDLA